MVEHQTPKSRFWGHIPSPRYSWVPSGIEVGFSNDLGQLRVGSVSVPVPARVQQGTLGNPMKTWEILKAWDETLRTKLVTRDAPSYAGHLKIDCSYLPPIMISLVDKQQNFTFFHKNSLPIFCEVFKVIRNTDKNLRLATQSHSGCSTACYCRWWCFNFSIDW